MIEKDITEKLVRAEITSDEAVDLLMAIGISRDDAEYKVSSLDTVDVSFPS